MTLSQAFFHSIYALQTPDIKPLERINIPLEIISSPQSLAILLSLNAQNFALYSQAASFLKIFAHIKESNPKIPLELTLQTIHILQYQLLESLQEQHIHFEDLLPYFVQLNLATILSNEEIQNLASLAKHSSSSPYTESDSDYVQIQQMSLKTLNQNFHALSLALTHLLPQSLQSKLESIAKDLQYQKFSIGITGVLSAGKSTFLNALLGEEILGSSSVPETANLTILRFGETMRARVHFWKEEQWNELHHLSQHDTNIKAFLEESENIFGTSLKEYITKEGITRDIQASELATYTSANHPSKLCNLIQEVELFTPLKFLQNGVEIVDTPGLDDPITKREEITRDYIQKCDLLIHIMNASCAATQIDIDFILESLLEQNISRLLVVLTRIDLLTPKELQASLDYTKQSLITQLKKAHYKGDIQAVIQRIDFIPLAGYTALLYRTNREQEAAQSGISLQQSGIIAIENYLDKMLLGEDSLKHKDILYLAYKAMEKLTQEALDLLTLKSKLLNTDKAELENFIVQVKTQNDELSRSLLNLKNHFESQLDELKAFLTSLEHFIDNTLESAKNQLKDTFFGDIAYAYAQGKKPSLESLSPMIEVSIKDCFADVGREYKYKLGKKIAQLTQVGEQTIQETQALAKLQPPHIHFQLTKEQLIQSTHTLLQALPSLIQSHSKSNQNALSIKLDTLFSEAFAHFGNRCREKSVEIKEAFLIYFDNIALVHQSHIQSQIDHKQAILDDALKQRDSNDVKNLKNTLLSQQTQLENIHTQILSHLQSLT